MCLWETLHVYPQILSGRHLVQGGWQGQDPLPTGGLSFPVCVTVSWGSLQGLVRRETAWRHLHPSCWGKEYGSGLRLSPSSLFPTCGPGGRPQVKVRALLMKGTFTSNPETVGPSWERSPTFSIRHCCVPKTSSNDVSKGSQVPAGHKTPLNLRVQTLTCTDTCKHLSKPGVPLLGEEGVSLLH